MMLQETDEINTSPKILEYGVHWNRMFGEKTDNSNWCVTDWYSVDNAPLGNILLVGFIGGDNPSITFQYHTVQNNDWYYFANQVGTRNIPLGSDNRLVDIAFSIEITEIHNSYVYVQETGQILFAGKNSIYYGHRNVSELN